MFTVRPENPHGGYSFYSCETYYVGEAESSDSGSERGVGITDTNDHQEPAFMTFSVGMNAPYSAVYVTNECGNTVDTIRAPSPPTRDTAEG